MEGSKVDPGAEKDTRTTVTSDMVAEGGGGPAAWLLNARGRLTSARIRLASLTPAAGCYAPLCRTALTPAACYSPCCPARPVPAALLETAAFLAALAKEAAAREVKDWPQHEDAKLETVEAGLEAVDEALRRLKVKQEEANDPNTILPVGPAARKPAETKTEGGSVLKSEIEGKPLETKASFELQSLKAEPGAEEKSPQRIYSADSPAAPLYLKRIQTVAEAKKPSRIVKYPLAPTFWSRSHAARNILISAAHDVRRLARTGGLTAGEGYNYGAKANQAVWPYPCPRPTFRTAWLYRTAGMASLHAVALQLRILWICIKWDDMATKAPNPDGKNQVTTDSEIVTTEILKHRNRGRFLEQTQYFQRRVSIPLDAPRKQVDYSPIRSGLRKRKRVESPVQAEPQVDEKWIDESELELWEIRVYRDKMDRERTAAGGRPVRANVKAPEKYDPSEDQEKKKRTTAASTDIKAKIDANIKEQREAFKASRSTTPDLPNSKPSLAGVGIRKSGDSSIRIVAANTSQATYTTSLAGAKKIFISRDGKIIGHQMSTSSPVLSATPPGKIAIAPAKPPAAPAPVVSSSPTAGTQQKVQIVKTADGKIQVRVKLILSLN